MSNDRQRSETKYALAELFAGIRTAPTVLMILTGLWFSSTGRGGLMPRPIGRRSSPRVAVTLVIYGSQRG